MNFRLGLWTVLLAGWSCILPVAQAQPIVRLSVREAQERLAQSPPPLVQLPAAYDAPDPWLAERRARFSIAFGSGLTLSGSTFLIAHPSMHKDRCTYHRSYGPAMGGIITGLGVGLVAGGALYLVGRHRKYRPFSDHHLGAELLLAMGGALLGTVATLWPESADSNGCHPQFHPHI